MVWYGQDWSPWGRIWNGRVVFSWLAFLHEQPGIEILREGGTDTTDFGPCL